MAFPHLLDVTQRPRRPVAPARRLPDSGNVEKAKPYLHWPPGLHRTDSGWVDEIGADVTDPETLERLTALAIPPAWRHVWGAPEPASKVQARGIDSRGRVQYKYSTEATQAAAANKYHHMLDFAQSLPALRTQVEKDLRRRPTTPDGPQVSALAVRLIDRGLFRVGTARYAAENHTYGLTTLLTDHVSADGPRISFNYVGKEHIEHTEVVEDPLSARIIRELLADGAPGEPLFCVSDASGQPCHRVTSASVNTYIHSAGDTTASAKTFRTWGGTVIAAAVMAGATATAHGPLKQHRDPTLHAFDAAAHVLGNTPTMARASYVHPLATRLSDHAPLQEAVDEAASNAGTTEVAKIFWDEDVQQAVLGGLLELMDEGD